MIVILNCPAFLGAAEMASALASRFEAGAALDFHGLLARPLKGEGTLEQRLYAAARRQVEQLKARGRPDVVLAHAFHEPEPLARLRELLADLDQEIRVFCPVLDRDALARAHDDGDVEQLSDLLDLQAQWEAAVAQSARQGEMGRRVAVDGCEAEQVAAAIWEALQQ